MKREIGFLVTVSAIIRLTGIDSITKRVGVYLVSRLARRFMIRSAAELREKAEQSLHSDLVQAFGSAGLLNHTTESVLSVVAASRMLDHLIDAAIVRLDPKFAKRLIDRLEIEYSPDDAVSAPSISDRLWSVAARLADSEFLGVKAPLRSSEQASRVEDRVRRTEAAIALHLSGVQNEDSGPTVELIDETEQDRVIEVLIRETEQFCCQVDVHGSSGEVLRVDLDDIFVSTPIERLGSYQKAVRRGSQHHHYYGHYSDHSFPDRWKTFFDQIERTVLLGDPGGGKSTLSKKLCLEVSRAAHDGNPQVSIFLQLRTFVAEWDQNKTLDFLSHISAQVRISAPDISHERVLGIVHHLLSTGRIFFVFDGLDEVLSLGNREEMVKKVRAFCDRYLLSRFLLTSRVVGYESTPVRNFDHFLVRELTGDSIKDLFVKVNSFIISKTEVVSDKSFDSFISDAQNKASELITNPLLLTLIIIIHSKKREIPDNRFDLYSSCADLLFDRWDGFRNIDPNLPERYRLYDLLMHLSAAIFEDETLGGRISKGAL